MRSVRVAAGVLARNGQVLVCQRRATDTHPLRWEFPGGKVEEGETASICARRELREELSIDAQTNGEIWHTTHVYDEVEIDLTFVAVPRFTGTPQNLCFAEIRWVAFSDLPSYDFLDADREFIAFVATF